MKARDIVPGWPKPKSTSTFMLARCNSEFLRWMLRMNRIDRPEKLAEFDATIEYHEAQQRMVNEYFERWRRPDVIGAVKIAEV